MAPAPIPAPTLERRTAELENGLIALELLIPLEPAGPKPVVIGMPELGPALFAAGMVSLSYRIDWSSRQDAPALMTPFPSGTGHLLLASPSPGRLGERYLRSIASIVQLALPRIVDYLEALPAADAGRVAVAGRFTDGFIALQALAHDDRIAAGVAVGACGDYHCFLRESPLGANGAPLALDASYEAWMTSQELVRHPERVVPAPLLLVNRADDPVVPIACADATARILSRAYAAADAPAAFRQLTLDDPAADANAPIVAFLRDHLVR